MIKRRLRLTLLVIVAAAIAIVVFNYLAAPSIEEETTNFRMPVASPILEPDRPDLIGEPAPPE